MPPVRQSVLVALPFAGALALVLVGAMTTPDPRGFGTHEQLGLAPCGLKEALGFPCPTCGVTTSLSHAIHGEVGAAWGTQPLGLLLVPAALALGVVALRRHRRGEDLALAIAQVRPRTWGVIAGVVLTCWLLGI